MAQKSVTATEFQNRIGAYMEQSGKEPVYITRHRRPVRVLVDFDVFERLKRHDTRQALYPHELSDELKAEFDKGYQGPRNRHLDHLLE